MCGDLRREKLNELAGNPQNPGVNHDGTWTKIGFKNLYTIDGTPQRALWNGHARSEALRDWLSNGWTVGTLDMGGYTEGRPSQVFEVPQGKVIKIVHRVVEQMGKSMTVFNIVTREAQGEERKVHNRFPVLVDKGA